MAFPFGFCTFSSSSSSSAINQIDTTRALSSQSRKHVWKKEVLSRRRRRRFSKDSYVPKGVSRIVKCQRHVVK
jgi:hypothetical protein